MSDINPAIDEWIGTYLTRFHHALEQVCESAICGGEHGVLVVHHPLAAETLFAAAFTVSVSTDVPYGEIHERWE